MAPDMPPYAGARSAVPGPAQAPGIRPFMPSNDLKPSATWLPNPYMCQRRVFCGDFLPRYMYSGGLMALFARQDKVDDAHVGIKSTALLFGRHTKAWLSGFAALNVSLLCITGADLARVTAQKPCKSRVYDTGTAA